MATFALSRWLCLRLLALCYLAAFWSWGLQSEGLMGPEGILPLEPRIEQVKQVAAQHQVNAWGLFPSVFLWSGTVQAQQVVCWLGGAAAILVAAGLCQGPLLLVCWALYLSLANAGAVFMGYQWEALLLEAGFLAIGAAPWRLAAFRPTLPGAAPRLAWYGLQFLLAKLMFLSGFVKVASLDPLWLADTALSVHYQTQPLPTPLAWYFHHLPSWFHSLSCRGMFFVELLLPLLMWVGRWGRLLGCLGFAGLMFVVILSGNYTYFNALTLVLALTLLDDSWWGQKLRSKIPAAPENPPESPPEGAQAVRGPNFRMWQHLRYAGFVPAVAILLLSAHSLLSTLVRRAPSEAAVGAAGVKLPWWMGATRNIAQFLQPSWLKSTLAPLEEKTAPFYLANGYGLFANMTDMRNEIVLEVSNDGGVWHEVSFRYKPGQEDAGKALYWVAPHQPRLDWQMWFAAFHPQFHPERDLANPSLNWFGGLAMGLLQNKKPVWDLLGPPPILPEAVKHFRAMAYRVRFTTAEERAATGALWHREPLGLWCPPLSLQK